MTAQMAGVVAIGLFLLAMPVWGQPPALNPNHPGARMRRALEEGDSLSFMEAALDSGACRAVYLPVPEAVLYEWVTVEVDSANVGSYECHPSDAEMGATAGDYVVWAPNLLPFHGWSYGPSYCQEWLPGAGDYETVSPPPCLPGATLTRQRICRQCLRHEWQERRELPPPPSEFDSLKARLK